MRRPVSLRLALVALGLTASAGAAFAESNGDLCAAPKLQTEKWQSRSEAGGMAVLLPPGFAALGMSGTQRYADAHFFGNGRKQVVIGSGAGPSVLTMGSDVNQMSDCQTVINGRRAEITEYSWTVEDRGMSPSGFAGPHYGAVARFFSTSTLRESFIYISSNMKSDVNYYRQIFWTATTGDAGIGAPTAAASPTVAATLVSAGPAAVASAPAPACVPKPDPALPNADAILDSALVQMLMSSSTPVTQGHAVLALKFSGETLAGLTVAESDLPDPTQRQLATLVASNLRAHDAHAPAQFLLRIDAQKEGLHYTVQPACTQ